MTFSRGWVRSTMVIASAGWLLAACDGKRGKMEEATFEVESVSLEKTEIKRTDDFGLPESKEFTFKACLTDTESRSPVTNSWFAVSDGVSKREFRTTSGGCFEWKELHTFSALQREQTMRMDRTFSSTETYTGAVTVSFAFNPWTQTLVDLRKASDPNLEPSARPVVGFDMNLNKDPLGVDPFSEAAMADVKLTFNGHDMRNTEITSLLTLKPAQRFRLSLKPQFLRRNVRNEVTYLDVRGGRFRVRMVIVSDSSTGLPTASDLVAYSESEMEVRPNGLAQRDVTVRIHDVAAVLSRNHFYLVMQPVGPAAALARPSVYQGFVGPLAGNDATVDLIPYDGDDTSFILAVDDSMSKLNAKVDAMELIQQVSGLQEDDSAALRGLLTSNLNDANVRPILREFCQKLYPQNQVVQVQTRSTWGIERTRSVRARDACSENPTSFLRLERREIVQEVTGQPRYRPDMLSSRSIALSRNLKYVKVQANSERRDHSTGYGWNGSAGFDLLGAITNLVPVVGQVIQAVTGLNLGLGLKANIGTDWLNSEGLARTEEVGMGATISESEQFQVASVGYDIDVRTRTCVMLSATISSDEAALRGYYACASDVRERTTTEAFYQINHSVTNSVFADALSSGSTMWRVMVRGQDSYNKFEDLMTKESGVLMFSQLKIDNPRAALLPDFKINQAFPGVISSR